MEVGEEGQGEICYCLEGEFSSIKTSGKCLSGISSLSLFFLLAPLDSLSPK